MPTNIVTATGGISAGPVQPTSSPFPSLAETFSLYLTQTRQVVSPGSRALASPAAFVDLLANSGITNCRLAAIRVSGGVIQIRHSTPSYAAQIIQCSDLWVVSEPTAGSEITALAIQGTAQVEYLLAGD
jgi:hypothetical protein